MTKGELMVTASYSQHFQHPTIVVPVTALHDFFNSNVVIPIGASRHPYADVLHEWIEDGTKILEAYTDKWDISAVDKALYPTTKYRIKPSEPVYEWQWYIVYDGLTHLDNNFYTEQEIIDFKHIDRWVKIEETKRVRA